MSDSLALKNPSSGIGARRERCIVIPAIKKNAVIPDQLVKKLAGDILIQRALRTAKAVVAGQDVLVVTDSDEIRLICERAGVGCEYNPAHAIRTLDIVSSLRPVLEHLVEGYERIIIYRAASPLITAPDIEDAYARFVRERSDCLVTVKSLKYRLWKERGATIDALLFNEEEETAYVETKALFMLRADALGRSAADGRRLVTTPYFLHDRGIEISSYLDWWVCEKILQSRHVVFVVAGYPAIGMGHIYRALMLAHEIADHRVTFLCTKQSELAASNIAARDYRTKMQTSDVLAEDVLRLRPDVVVNDILNTETDYIAALKERGVAVVNFEDEGPGAAHADLVVNALYENRVGKNERFLCGYRNFCLRDEFLNARRNEFRPRARRVLITFGGTDASDFTRKTLDAIIPLCRERDIGVTVVAGPGYAHKEALAEHVTELQGRGDTLSFTYATNIMSREMENIDLAVCSAGRTVYELAHMRIPAVVLSHHIREDMHTFARPRNGFVYLGVMGEYRAETVRRAFASLLDGERRAVLYRRLSRFDFSGNKSRVIGNILALLSNREKS
ncbi:MAG: cytidine 5'-phosphate N-acetylneuraminic acid synthetase [Desulfovibrio sp.]|jgi:spore coat polysaccharide biosynthesis predicted glycosyltransferase SpsG/CMP-N-acetylneuraminic acid synthetase|nr:cytidine 5'-phosphate N-acetylneuraminic acid synthetase [Desulfovibrio sp.]